MIFRYSRNLFILSLVLILLLSACGGDNNTGNQNNNGDAGKSPSDTTVGIPPNPDITGYISDVVGDVVVFVEGDDPGQDAENGMVINFPAAIVTGENGRVRLDISTGTVMRLGPNSVFEWQGVVEDDNGTLLTKVSVILGDVWALILRGQTLEIDTPSGVASVRGAETSVSVNVEEGYNFDRDEGFSLSEIKEKIKPLIEEGKIDIFCVEGICKFKKTDGEDSVDVGTLEKIFIDQVTEEISSALMVEEDAITVISVASPSCLDQATSSSTSCPTSSSSSGGGGYGDDTGGTLFESSDSTTEDLTDHISPPLRSLISTKKHGDKIRSADYDQDEIPNDVDLCPTLGSIGYGVDETGCPYLEEQTEGSTAQYYYCSQIGDLGLGLDENGCPIVPDEGDYDEDGVINAVDQCKYIGDAYGFGVDGFGCPYSSENGDYDGDGVLDSEDECPFDAGVGKYATDIYGCPVRDDDDADKDGIKDILDKCPNTGPEGAFKKDQSSLDDSGCPTTPPLQDADKDGVVDLYDTCPFTKGGKENTGCPDKNDEKFNPDRDGDGVPNSQDQCPDLGDKLIFDVNENGCPELPTQIFTDGFESGNIAGILDWLGSLEARTGFTQDELLKGDLDGDGVPNGGDLCPLAGKLGRVDENGCPDTSTKEDIDGDGVPNGEDECAIVGWDILKGQSISNGCPEDTAASDTDGDGVLDGDDRCLYQGSLGNGVDATGCPYGSADGDADGDGVPDEEDNCQVSWNILTGTASSTGCEEPDPSEDSDGDGIADGDDNCPSLPSDDEDGCPTVIPDDISESQSFNDKLDKLLASSSYFEICQRVFLVSPDLRREIESRLGDLDCRKYTKNKVDDETKKDAKSPGEILTEAQKDQTKETQDSSGGQTKSDLLDKYTIYCEYSGEVKTTKECAEDAQIYIIKCIDGTWAKTVSDCPSDQENTLPQEGCTDEEISACSLTTPTCEPGEVGVSIVGSCCPSCLTAEVTTSSFFDVFFDITIVQRSDKDRDGVDDRIDACIQPRYNGPVDERGCAILDPNGDYDGDGVLNIQDECPFEIVEVGGNIFIGESGCSNYGGTINLELDLDGDGVTASTDNCPLDDGHPYGVDATGCPLPAPDTDGDGVADDVDACPYRGDIGFGLRDNGCPKPNPDFDGDGFLNTQDACPLVGDRFGLGVDDRGCPYQDSDGDGVFNRDDACPRVGSIGFGLKNNGCPVLDVDGDGIGDDKDPCPGNPDCDGDGLIDSAEPAPACIQNPDCDGDGLNDSTDPCPTRSDCDNDGIPDNVEYNNAPKCLQDPDCDGDGIKDGSEAAPKCILNPDCDGDGLGDGDEPPPCILNPDCDGDGIQDGNEAKLACVVRQDCDNDGFLDPVDPCPIKKGTLDGCNN